MFEGERAFIADYCDGQLDPTVEFDVGRCEFAVLKLGFQLGQYTVGQIVQRFLRKLSDQEPLTPDEERIALSLSDELDDVIDVLHTAIPDELSRKSYELWAWVVLRNSLAASSLKRSRENASIVLAEYCSSWDAPRFASEFLSDARRKMFWSSRRDENLQRQVLKRLDSERAVLQSGLKQCR